MTVNKGFRISRNPMRNQRAESGERALDKALAEFRPRQRREEKMRRAGEDFRAKGERRSTENGRGACAAKKKVPLHLVKSMIRTFRDQIFQDENLLYSQGLPRRLLPSSPRRFVSLLQPRDEQRMSPPPSPIHIREEKVCGGNPRCTTVVPVLSKW